MYLLKNTSRATVRYVMVIRTARSFAKSSPGCGRYGVDVVVVGAFVGVVVDADDDDDDLDFPLALALAFATAFAVATAVASLGG